jgi:hypothetical protein
MIRGGPFVLRTHDAGFKQAKPPEFLSTHTGRQSRHPRDQRHDPEAMKYYRK